MATTQTATKPKQTTQPAQEATSKGAVAVLHAPRLPYHDAVKQAGFDESQWRTLVEAVFPAAQTIDAVLLAINYCKARKLDIFKRTVHIVPIWDSKKDNGPGKKTGGLIETVWPGIAEHRITACRTGQYAGADPANFGPVIDHVFTWANEEPNGETSRGNFSMKFPEWCQITVYKIVQGQRFPVPGPRVYWLETYSRKGRSILPNDKWQRAPFQMIEKCAEAAALRRAFPEEFGDEWTAEEAGAIEIAAESAVDVTPKPQREETKPETKEPEPFALVDGDGELWSYPDVNDAVDDFIRWFEEASDKNAVEGLWESNSLSGQLRDRGYVDLAEACHKAYLEAFKRFEPKPVAENAQSKVQTIPVPLAEDGVSTNWKAWGTAFVAAIKTAKSETELGDWIIANNPAYSNCAEPAPKVRKSVETAIEKMRAQLKPADAAPEPEGDLLATNNAGGEGEKAQ